MKQPVLGAVPLDGRVMVEETVGAFARTADHVYVFSAHLAPVETTVPDYVAVAERLLGTPYLWGGKSSLGIDCSGVVQLSASLGGLSLPRDTDMQAKIGESVLIGRSLEGLARGDLVFWRKRNCERAAYHRCCRRRLIDDRAMLDDFFTAKLS